MERTRVTELRDYLIAEGHLDDFVAAWKAGVLPLREASGFRVDGAWVVDGESRFIWLLSLDGDWDEFERRNAAYYQAPARVALDPDPAQWIVEARQSRLRAVHP